MEAQLWLHLQLAWDLYQAMHSPAAAESTNIQRWPALEAAAREFSETRDTQYELVTGF